MADFGSEKQFKVKKMLISLQQKLISLEKNNYF